MASARPCCGPKCVFTLDDPCVNPTKDASSPGEAPRLELRVQARGLGLGGVRARLLRGALRERLRIANHVQHARRGCAELARSQTPLHNPRDTC